MQANRTKRTNGNVIEGIFTVDEAPHDEDLLLAYKLENEQLTEENELLVRELDRTHSSLSNARRTLYCILGYAVACTIQPITDAILKAVF